MSRINDQAESTEMVLVRKLFKTHDWMWFTIPSIQTKPKYSTGFSWHKHLDCILRMHPTDHNPMSRHIDNRMVYLASIVSVEVDTTSILCSDSRNSPSTSFDIPHYLLYMCQQCTRDKHQCIANPTDMSLRTLQYLLDNMQICCKSHKHHLDNQWTSSKLHRMPPRH